MSAIVKKDFSKLCRPYQDQGVTFLFENDEALLLLRMGGGKTVITMTAIMELMKAGEIHSVLICAPLAVCNNTWRHEYLEWNETAGLDIGICTGSVAKRRKVMDAEGPITVINYDNLQWLAANYPKRRFDLIVMDEITRFNKAGKRYRAFRPYLRDAKMRWGLTGSFAANNVEHMFNPVRCIDLGKTLGEGIEQFRREYFFKDTFGYTAKPGVGPVIAERIKHLTYQPDPEVYRSQLPMIVYQRHTFEFSKEVTDTYHEMAQEYVISHGDDVIDAASAGVLVGKLQQLSSGFLYREDKTAIHLDSTRKELLTELLLESAPEPVVIWYWFDHTRRLLEGWGFLNLVDNLDAWNQGRIPVAICHPRSGGHGINAQAGGSRHIFYEHTWSAEERAQAIARLHRQGQKNTVFVHDIVGEIEGNDAIDATILNAIRNKQNVAKAVYKTLL